VIINNNALLNEFVFVMVNVLCLRQIIIINLKSSILHLLRKEHRCITSVGKYKINKTGDRLIYVR